MLNPFTYEDNEYVREFNPIADYIDIQTLYLSRMTGKPTDYCKEFVTNNIRPDGLFPIRDPEVKYLSRENSRDRYRTMTTMGRYIKSIRDNNFIMTPAWSVYVPTTVEESMYVGYIDKKTSVRSKYKKAMFIAEQRNDTTAIKFNNEMQQSAKIGINAISGAALMPATINYCASLHNSLTSTCAMSTCLANLNNEKLIAGNRLYLTYQFVLDNICTVVLKTNYDALKTAMDKYDIYYPNTDDVMECIAYSSDIYWRDSTKMNKLRFFVDTLTPLEKAAFLYIGDLYHLDKHNPELMENFFKGFIQRTYENMDIEEAEKQIKSADSDTEILAKLICKDYMMGTTLEDLKESAPEKYGQIASNMVMVQNHVKRFEDFIKGLLRPNFTNPGSNRFGVPNMVRRAVLTSDTDSTIYTAQHWVKRFNGNIGFEDRHYNIGFVVSFLVNKTVFHQLALMSKNMGLEVKNLHKISMKNEYYFPIYVLTNSAKNYFALKSVREGNVYSKMKLEKKGVELRSSKVPKNIMNRFDEYIVSMMNKIIEKQNITMDELLSTPYEVENEVRQSILNGEPLYLPTQQIKNKEAYKVGDNAPALQSHRLWEHVFADKYGPAPELPYVALKVSTKLTSKRKLEEWLGTLEDSEFKNNLVNYLKNEGRNDLSTIYVPKLTIGFKGLPKEILSVINPDKQVMNVMSSFYLTLESFGFYLRNPNNTVMIHEYYKPKNINESA